MGTSGSFKGSGGKDAGDLRDAISEWLSEQSPSETPPDSTPEQGQSPPPSPDESNHPISPSSISPIIHMWGGGGSNGSSGGGGSSSQGKKASQDNDSSGSGGRSSGGVRRTVSRVAGPAGRASSLANAYASGDRNALEAAGLNYDDLRTLNDPLEVGKRIAEVAFDTKADSTIEDSESRFIVAELVSWILEAPEDQQPEPNDIVRRSIELMIAQSTLVEVGDTIRKEKNQSKRHDAEKEIRNASRVMASQVNLGDTGMSSTDITSAIEGSVAQLKEIYGKK